MIYRMLSWSLALALDGVQLILEDSDGRDQRLNTSAFGTFAVENNIDTPKREWQELSRCQHAGRKGRKNKVQRRKSSTRCKCFEDALLALQETSLNHGTLDHREPFTHRNSHLGSIRLARRSKENLTRDLSREKTTRKHPQKPLTCSRQIPRRRPVISASLAVRRNLHRSGNPLPIAGPSPRTRAARC